MHARFNDHLQSYIAAITPLPPLQPHIRWSQLHPSPFLLPPGMVYIQPSRCRLTCICEKGSVQTASLRLTDPVNLPVTFIKSEHEKGLAKYKWCGEWCFMCHDLCVLHSDPVFQMQYHACLQEIHSLNEKWVCFIVDAVKGIHSLQNIADS